MAKFKKKDEYPVEAPVESTPVESADAPVVITDDDLLSPATIDEVTTTDRTMAAVAATVPAGVMMMTPADIAAIVQAAIAGMQSANTKGIGQEIADALKEYKGVRPKTVAEIGEPDTPFNPLKKKRDLNAEYFQNGAPIHPRMLHDNEIEMLHQLVPGTYGPADFVINVIEKSRLDGGKKRVFIMYPGGKGDRLKEKNYGANFHLFLSHLVAEAKEQRAARKAAARKFLEDD